MYYVINTASALVDTTIIAIFLHGLFQNYDKRLAVVRLAFGLCWLAFTIILVVPMVTPLRLALGMGLFLILGRYLFRPKWLKLLLSALLLGVIVLLTNVMSLWLFGAFGQTLQSLQVYGNGRLFYLALITLGRLFLVFIVIKVSRWRKEQDSLLNTVPILLCQVFSVFITYVLMHGSQGKPTLLTLDFIISVTAILFINIVIFLYVERVKAAGEIKKQNALAEQLYGFKLEYFEQVRDDQEMTRALWHDIKKYLNTMNVLMNRNDIEQAQECITQVNELFGTIGNVVDVGNTILSAVLNHSVQKAHHQNIETVLDVKVQPDLAVPAADLSVIIGNTFDNAIEACAPLPQEARRINIRMWQEGQQFSYEIKNLYDKWHTPKTEKKIHGFGLKNVTRCVDKYKGTMIVDASDQEYTVTVQIQCPPVAAWG